MARRPACPLGGHLRAALVLLGGVFRARGTGRPVPHSSKRRGLLTTRRLRWAALRCAALRELSLGPRGVTRARTGL